MPQRKQKTADEIIAEAKAAYKASGGGKMAPAPAPMKPAPAPKAPPQKSMSDELTNEALRLQKKRTYRPNNSPFVQGISPDCVSHRKISK